MKLLPKYVALISFGILMILFTTYGIITYTKPYFPPAIPIYTKNLPTGGKPDAPIHIVIFQDISYQNSIDFNQLVYPPIKRHYIDTGLVKYSVSLVSFSSISKLSSEILYCALSDSTQTFFTLLNQYFDNPFNLNIPRTDLINHWLSLAKTSINSSNFQNFKTCINNGLSDSEISYNTSYAKDLMGAYFQIPAVYVNGMKVLDPSLEEIERFILHALKKTKALSHDNQS